MYPAAASVEITYAVIPVIIPGITCGFIPVFFYHHVVLILGTGKQYQSCKKRTIPDGAKILP